MKVRLARNAARTLWLIWKLAAILLKSKTMPMLLVTANAAAAL